VGSNQDPETLHEKILEHLSDGAVSGRHGGSLIRQGLSEVRSLEAEANTCILGANSAE